MITHEHFDEYGPLKAGARRKIDSRTLKFDITATVQSLEPESWRVEVTLFGETVLKPEGTFPTKHAAGAAAEAALRQHLVRLFKA